MKSLQPLGSKLLQALPLEQVGVFGPFAEQVQELLPQELLPVSELASFARFAHFFRP